MKIKVFQGGYDKNLCYLLWCKESLRAAIIDPSVETLKIFEFIENTELILEKILVTHTHHDHIAYIDDFLFNFPNIKVYGYKDSVKITKDEKLKLLSGLNVYLIFQKE